jgi:hypothetical protein
VAPKSIPSFIKIQDTSTRPGGLFGSAGRVANTLLGGWSVSTIINYFSGAQAGLLRLIAAGRRLERRCEPPHHRARRQTQRRVPKEQVRVLDSAIAEQHLPQQGDFFRCGPPIARNLIPLTGVRRIGTINEDFGLRKNTFFKEGWRLQFRAEFLNAFNRSPLGAPDTNVTSLNFGQIISIGGNRTVQLGMRLDF